jgi:hypothetical protein
VKSLEWRARKASRKGRAPLPVVAEALGKLGALLEHEDFCSLTEQKYSVTE